jgi:hypothetical protein
MEENIMVVVVEKGIVTEVHSLDTNIKIIVVDEDNRRVCESFITEFGWLTLNWMMKELSSY